uniref:Polyprenyl synthetase family protein n=1 Tax=Eiseniibacteriota bacterium TaxID=2212470 RepID=A0A832MKI1_UNCEI
MAARATRRRTAPAVRPAARPRRKRATANVPGPPRRARPATAAVRRAPAKRPAADPLRAMREAFEAHFAKTLRANGAPRGRLGEAILYSALGPGKRLRPLLVLATAEAVGGEWREALPAAAAVECVHAFSLVHDDLPAMDDDDMRRGRPTTHRRFGEALGVLAGDALLAFAFEEITRLPAARHDPRRVLACVRMLADAAGANQLIEGQALDIEAEGRRADREVVEAIHVRKTGALIAASMALGALAGGAPIPQVHALYDAGLDLGLAFQIHDDLLNARSSLARLGKRAGTDAARGKATWPSAVGIERAVQDAGALYAAVMERLRPFGPRAARLVALVSSVAERER